MYFKDKYVRLNCGAHWDSNAKQHFKARDNSSVLGMRMIARGEVRGNFLEEVQRQTE